MQAPQPPNLGEFELSAQAERLLREMQAASSELKASSEANDVDLHFKQTVGICRLSRRTRLKLGSLWNLSGTVRERIIEIFSDCASSINPSLEYGEERQPHVDHAIDNIKIRVSHIEDPQRVEQELMAMTGG